MIQSIISCRRSWRPRVLPTLILHGLSDLQHLTAPNCSGVASRSRFRALCRVFVTENLSLIFPGTFLV